MGKRLVALILISVLCGVFANSVRAADSDEGKAKAKKAEAAQKMGDEEYYELFKTLADTMDQVERNYVKEISRREMMEAAIEGIVKKLDPYSSYIKPEDLGEFRTNVNSKFGGIGIRITIDPDDRQLKVLSPLVGTPAYRAGLRAGDKIVEIEGETTKGISMTEAVKRLKGKAGTAVTITIVHPTSGERETVTIEREVIRIHTVLGDRRRDDDNWDYRYDSDGDAGNGGIGYIRITAFSRDTARELRAALDDLQKGKKKLRGLVLDLRFNPGGLLTSAIEICDMFVQEGLIVKTEGRSIDEQKWEAHKEDTYTGFPIAVLVNRYSASASEIVSACLQDHDRAIVVGERTWGKASVQNVIELDGGASALKLTTAGYQRPSGKNIHRFPDAKDSDEWGVMPNKGYRIRLADSELARLMNDRRQRDLILMKTKPIVPVEGQPPEPEVDEPTTDKPFVDRQLKKALDYLSQEIAKVE